MNKTSYMTQEGKKVIVPWEEYQRLSTAMDDVVRAREELAKDSKERGFYVDTTMIFTDYGTVCSPLYRTKNLINIVSKDEVLEAAQKEIDRLSTLAESLSRQLDEKERTIERLKSRRLLARIFNIK